MFRIKNNNKYKIEEIIKRHILFYLGFIKTESYRDSDKFYYEEDENGTNLIKILILLPLKIVFLFPIQVIYEIIIINWNFSIIYEKPKECRICKSKYYNDNDNDYYNICDNCKKKYVIENREDINKIIILRDNKKKI